MSCSITWADSHNNVLGTHTIVACVGWAHVYAVAEGQAPQGTAYYHAVYGGRTVRTRLHKH